MARIERTPYLLMRLQTRTVMARWSDGRRCYEIICQVTPAIWQMIETAIIREIARRRTPNRWQALHEEEVEFDKYEGKEALLLMWIAAQAPEPDVLARAVTNWTNLAPEERWWLVTQAEATAGSVSYGPHRGWRKAIYIALTEG
jgi:hypothetical protein